MLTVNEIFYSIQGESTRAGLPCVFVRLTACDLRCSWCDTPYAFHEGRKQSVDEVVAAVERHQCPLVEITGALWSCTGPDAATTQADTTTAAASQVRMEAGITV